MFEVEFWENENGKIFARDFIKGQSVKIQSQLMNALNNLSKFGHELTKPQVSYMSDQIYELKERYIRIQYRLYFFYDGNKIVVTHGAITDHKKDYLEIEYAKRCRRTYLEMKRK